MANTGIQRSDTKSSTQATSTDSFLISSVHHCAALFFAAPGKSLVKQIKHMHRVTVQVGGHHLPAAAVFSVTLLRLEGLHVSIIL